MKVSYMKNFGLHGDLKPQPSALLADVEANIFHIWNLHIFVPLVLNHIFWITVNPQVPLFSMYLLFQLTLLYINALEIFIKSFVVITKIIIINQWFILSSQISKKKFNASCKMYIISADNWIILCVLFSIVFCIIKIHINTFID